jgi:hypothetical protein
MVRAGFAILFGACAVLVATSLLFPAEDVPVRVFLRDGSFVQAQAMPERRDQRVFFRLHPSGMLAVLPAERVDFEATARAAAEAVLEAPVDATPQVKGTVSGGSGARGSAVAPDPAEPPAPQGVPALELQHPDERALEERYALEFTFLSERQEALESAIAALRLQESEIDRELRRYLYQPKLAGALADKLRGVQEYLARREGERQQVQTELQVLLSRAASRGVRLRRLPSVGGS